ncbi:helix-turn-helix domain-containing protein [Chryseobacterium limigenitum]|uniref:Helix-turn-helix domain-containing protein n=1 Tax=Chryseobacterium limigenitum TaxID=1612149 RepID=A0A1K2IGL6_9FLAO|nr:Helix-turn-helix domain-containing protein [Chryseobacterium limigenitum]
MNFNFNDPNKPIQIIQIDTLSLFEIIKQLKPLLSEKTTPKKWLTLKEAKTLLGIKSSTTILKLKNEGKLRYCNLTSKKILYDYDSIMEYLKSNAEDTF